MANDDAPGRTGHSHRIRKELFQRGLRQGWLSLPEIERALPRTTGQGERWLFLYSLRAAGIELRDGRGGSVDLPPAPPVE
ncbi:MAG TPA: hypothetical protein VFK85_08670 [Anaeromyxobacteraceae bacterium]|nr:hypothetical protein [Anaeromyxobacteraceae bacterium]